MTSEGSKRRDFLSLVFITKSIGFLPIKKFSRGLLCNKVLEAMSNFEEELFLTQSSFSGSLEAGSRQLDFLCE